MGRTGGNWLKRKSEGPTVIFEGRPERFELQWNLLKAKVGELIPAEIEAAKRDRWPRMVVTFQVTRLYKGTSVQKIQVETGLGGGEANGTEKRDSLVRNDGFCSWRRNPRPTFEAQGKRGWALKRGIHHRVSRGAAEDTETLDGVWELLEGTPNPTLQSSG